MASPLCICFRPPCDDTVNVRSTDDNINVRSTDDTINVHSGDTINVHSTGETIKVPSITNEIKVPSADVTTKVHSSNVTTNVSTPPLPGQFSLSLWVYVFVGITALFAVIILILTPLFIAYFKWKKAARSFNREFA